jgi:hypothetical protein
LDDQEHNIAKAVPSGFSLASIPGLSGASEMFHAAGDTARAAGHATANAARRAAGAAEGTTRSALSWLLPLAALALVLIALGLWSYFRSNAGPAAADAAKKVGGEVHTMLKPELPSVPDVAAVSKDVSGIFTSATDTLAGIHDAASAAAALPQLNDLSGKIDGVRNVLDKLPEAGQAAVGQLIGKQMAGFKEEAAKALAIPGVGEQLRRTLAGITNQFTALNFAQVSQDATDVLGSLTKTLSSFKDAATAESSAPQLRQIAGKIDELKQIRSAMSPGGRSMLAKLVAAALGPLDQLISKVLAQLGPSASGIKPILDDIVNKLTELAAPPSTA